MAIDILTQSSPSLTKTSQQSNSLNHESEAPPTDRSILDAVALKAKYDAEREKRLAANTAGFAQYNLIDREDPFFGKYLDDPYIEQKIVRDPVDQETEVLIIGGGYSAQIAAVRLMEKDITDIKLIEKGGDFGGTW